MEELVGWGLSFALFSQSSSFHLLCCFQVYSHIPNNHCTLNSHCMQEKRGQPSPIISIAPPLLSNLFPHFEQSLQKKPCANHLICIDCEAVGERMEGLGGWGLSFALFS